MPLGVAARARAASGDAWQAPALSISFSCLQGVRGEDFAPVKNAEGAGRDSPVRRLRGSVAPGVMCRRQWQFLAGQDASLMLSPAFGLPPAGHRPRARRGAPSLVGGARRGHCRGDRDRRGALLCHVVADNCPSCSPHFPEHPARPRRRCLRLRRTRGRGSRTGAEGKCSERRARSAERLSLKRRRVPVPPPAAGSMDADETKINKNSRHPSLGDSLSVRKRMRLCSPLLTVEAARQQHQCISSSSLPPAHIWRCTPCPDACM